MMHALDVPRYLYDSYHGYPCNCCMGNNKEEITRPMACYHNVETCCLENNLDQCNSLAHFS